MSIFRLTTTDTTAISPTLYSRSQKVKEGLKLILGHFDGEPLWPRTVSTRNTNGRQIAVNNMQEVMTLYAAANYLDCRMNAYPQYTNFHIDRTGIAPSLLLVDLDKILFKTTEEFELAAVNTRMNFRKFLGSDPTILWSGGGYHFIKSQSAEVFEESDTFREFVEPSRQFLEFEEQLLSDGKADQCHSRNVSFLNCMLRIPYSINSKRVQFGNTGKIINIPSESEVRVIHYDNGRASITPLVRPYYIWLQAGVIKDTQKRMELEQRNRKCRSRGVKEKEDKIDWIERLFNTPISNFREYCTTFIFIPYFINIRGLSHSETKRLTMDWLSRCNSLSRLHFDAKWKVNYQVNRVEGYKNTSCFRLEERNKPLYLLLKKEGII